MQRFLLLPIALATAHAVHAQDVPTRFASAGSIVAVRFANAPAGPVVLRALGRNWTEPVTVDKETLEVTLPTARVPLRFDIVSPEAPEQPLARVVSYPNGHRLAWDEKVPLWIDADGPAWLPEWLKAVGISSTTIAPNGLVPRAKGGLFIIGRTRAAKSAEEFAQRRAGWPCPVLVLDAEWFGRPETDAVQVGELPDQFGHALSELNRYAWPGSLTFHGSRSAWEGIANRFVWIDGPTSPLVERIHAPGHQVVLSYLDWPQQLGLETADAMFLAVLREAARADAPPPELGRDFVLHMSRPEFLTPRLRPVLFAAHRERGKVTGDKRPPLQVLDLRGTTFTDSEVAALPEVTNKNDWIVLGRQSAVTIPPVPTTESGNSKKDRIVRMFDVGVPAVPLQKVRLMQALSDHGVYFGHLSPHRREP